MYTSDGIYIGLADGERINMSLNICNRHGLIAGASGTGKTITMKVLTESFSDAGVPVFLCDVKGDVSGLVCPGEQNEGMEKRIDKFGIRDDFTYRSYPVTFWDIYGEKGHPIRATVSDMGPSLLARILNLTPAQEGVLNIVFRIADDHGLELIDLKDLYAMLSYVGEHKQELIPQYGNIAQQSLGGIQRALLPLETEGGDLFLGEPALDIRDWIRTDHEGHGMINLLSCEKLVLKPTLYATFLLWLMSTLYETLPEVGDLEKPKLVFFFDEAHFLFADAPKALVQKIEQVVKLIRSKGVGIYFCTQNPADIPDSVLAQLSNRFQHALRAYTPTEIKAVKAAANSLRENPKFKTEDVIMELGTGEALISVLDEKGVPGIVQKASVLCPQSLMAQADSASIQAAIASDNMTKYDQPVANISAYETLQERKEREEEEKRLEEERIRLEKEREAFEAQKAKEEAAAEKARQRQREKEEAARQRAAERRKNQIERQIINAGAQILKRGLLNTLKR